MYLIKDLSYLWMVFFIMIVAGLAKEYDLFAPAYAYVKNTFRSNKFVVVLLSALGGVLPIEGRVTVSAGLLDTVAPAKGEGREKFGIVDYLATHHYYLWSPLEKTVILPIAAFGLTYAAWIIKVLPLLIVSFGFIFLYIWYQIKDEDVAIKPVNFNLGAVIRNVVPMVVAIAAYASGIDHVLCFGVLAFYYALITQQWAPKKLLGYINWEVLIMVAVVIIVGNWAKSHSDVIQAAVKESTQVTGLPPLLAATAVSFLASFAMGSSGKFVAIAVMLAQVFGVEYFLWFFAVDYAAYLLSPTHKCVAVGNRYFGTSLKTYYSVLGMWAVVLLCAGSMFTFIY